MVLMIYCKLTGIQITLPHPYFDIICLNKEMSQIMTKTNTNTCVPSEPGLISLCCALLRIAKDLRLLHADREDSDKMVGAQADLSLRWVYMSFCLFFHTVA